MADQRNLKHLLENTKNILKHHKEVTEIKGENFNLFSVLGIESRENKTHSAFLVELLNPKGSHLQKDIFLKLFLQVIQKEIAEQENDVREEQSNLVETFINSYNTSVSPEFPIGSRNDLDKEGGRVDIFIKNRKTHICIENKIYASDQNCQIERYCNYNNEKNTVLYLTLKGESPSKQSSGSLKAGKDFYNISYKKHIVEWLKLCLKEVPNLTSVREAINQYILLIKKLTHTLHMDQKNDLQDIMASYIEEAAFIAENYDAMTIKLKEGFRIAIKKGLADNLDSEIFTVKDGSSADNKLSHVWVIFKSYPEAEIKFGLESFSGRGHIGGNLFVGLWNKNGTSRIVKDIKEENKINDWWKQTRPFFTKANNPINLNHQYTLKILANPKSDKYSELKEEVVNQTLKFIKDYEVHIFQRLAEEKVKNEKAEALAE